MTSIAKLALAIAIVALASVGVATVFAPEAVCGLSPSTCELDGLDAGLFVDRTATDEERAAIASMNATARAVVTAHLGPFEGQPTILVCTTASCHQRLGGTGARAIAYGGLGARFSPAGLTQHIFTHELAHVRIGELVGTVPIFLEQMPAWLNEGLAVIISQDPLYLEQGQTCASPIGALPSTSGAWIRDVSSGIRPLYALAACAAAEWIESGGGWSRVPGRLANHDW